MNRQPSGVCFPQSEKNTWKPGGIAAMRTVWSLPLQAIMILDGTPSFAFCAFHRSRGIRQKLYTLAKEQQWREKYNIMIGFPHDLPQGYSEWLARSRFCLVSGCGPLYLKSYAFDVEEAALWCWVCLKQADVLSAVCPALKGCELR